MKNLDNSSTNVMQRSFHKSASPQVQSVASEQNSGTLTDKSSSFESSISTSARRQGSASRKEVRFRDDVAPMRETQQRNHQMQATDGEFILETSAFRAAMTMMTMIMTVTLETFLRDSMSIIRLKIELTRWSMHKLGL